MFERVTSQEKKLCTEVRDTTEWILCLNFFATPVQIHCPFLLLNYIPSPSIFLFSYFRLFALNSDNSNFFRFAWEVRGGSERGVFRESGEHLFFIAVNRERKIIFLVISEQK